MTIEILRQATNGTRLAQLAPAQVGDMIKAAVDLDRRGMG